MGPLVVAGTESIARLVMAPFITIRICFGGLRGYLLCFLCTKVESLRPYCSRTSGGRVKSGTKGYDECTS